MFQAPGNIIAYLALIVFPILSLFLYTRKSVPEAIVWTLTLGYLLLPVRTWIDPPVFPLLDKIAIPAMAVLFFSAVYSGRRIEVLPKDTVPKALILVLILAPSITAFNNTDQIVIGATVLPGMQVFGGEAISLLVSQFFFLVPFVLGRQYLSALEDREKLIKILVMCGVVYSFAIFWEIRMSPQLHTNFYGYFPHTTFLQQMRAGGFRAVVFLGHGLLTTLLLVSTLMLLFYMMRHGKKVFSYKAMYPAGFVLLAIIFNKTFAGYLYTLFAIMFCFVLSPRLRRLALLSICVLVISYPIFRTTSFYPDLQIVEFAARYSEDRSQSIQFRFDNENILLEKASRKPYTGWGVWARNRVYDENGIDISVSDGGWIIDLGIYGWLGFICKYLLLTWPIFQWMKLKKYYGDSTRVDGISVLSCILAIVLFDNLINAGISPITWLISGTLLGASERYKREIAEKIQQARALAEQEEAV